MCWNGVSKTHGNLAGLSSSDRGVSFSQRMHNLKWLRIRLLDAIWKCNVHSIYYIITDLAFLQKSWASEWNALELYEFLEKIFSTSYCSALNRFGGLLLFIIIKTPANTFPVVSDVQNPCKCCYRAHFYQRSKITKVGTLTLSVPWNRISIFKKFNI